MSSSITSGTLSSAGAGAALGTAIAPGIGTAIGAIVGGVVGAVGGALTGSKASKAKKYARMAAAVKEEREENSAYDQYLQYIRQARIARAQSVQAAANTNVGGSSLFTGAVSGQGSQVAYSTQYSAEDWRLNSLYNTYMRLAQKNSGKAEEFAGIHKAVDTTVAAVASVYGMANAGASSAGSSLKGDFWSANQNASTFDLGSLTSTVNV